MQRTWILVGAAVVVALGLYFFTRSDAPQEVVAPAATEAPVADTLEDASDATMDAVDSTADTATEAGEATVDAVEDAAESATDAVDGAIEEADDAIEDETETAPATAN